jgi:maleylpyruvate isomerase
MRTREVWIHAVDLDNGAQFSDFPDVVLESLLADIVEAWRRRRVGTDLVLEVTAAEPVAVGDGGGIPVRGPLPALVRWAAGRGAVDVTSDGDIPAPPSWL